MTTYFNENWGNFHFFLGIFFYISYIQVDRFLWKKTVFCTEFFLQLYIKNQIIYTFFFFFNPEKIIQKVDHFKRTKTFSPWNISKKYSILSNIILTWPDFWFFRHFVWAGRKHCPISEKKNHKNKRHFCLVTHSFTNLSQS